MVLRLMMLPPAPSKAATACLVASSVPSTLVPNCLSMSASVTASIGAKENTPALLTRTLGAPSLVFVSANSRVTSALLLTFA